MTENPATGQKSYEANQLEALEPDTGLEGSDGEARRGEDRNRRGILRRT